MQGEDAGVIDMCRVQEQIGRLVIKTKFLLLTEQQANKSRGKVLEQEIATLFGKPAGRKDGGLVPQRSILPKLEFWLLLKGERVWLAVANFLMPEFFVFASVHLGVVTMFLQTSNKTNIILCFATFYF